MPCRVCDKALPADAGQTWPFPLWVEGRLLPVEATICVAHAVQRACDRCLEPTPGLEDRLCRLCREFGERGVG